VCGIAGIVGLRDKSALEKAIGAMTDRLSHRGPDADGFFCGDQAALGHRRLSIIDLSASANQPIFDVSGRYAIILNGEIYNYRELKAGVPDYPFKTNGDAEVVLASFLKYGAKCLELLNGMFAFAIWDDEQKELFVARDRLGVKPLYYARMEDRFFIFASEIRSILETELVPRKINEKALYEYLQYQSVYSPRTIVENINQLPAGTFGIFRNGQFSITPYWQIDKNQVDVPRDRDAIVSDIRALFRQSIERRMVSDVPVGAFLSGGIDSSAVVAAMAEVSDQPVNTFSVVFDEEKFDESRYSDLIAKKFRTNHTSIKLKADDFLAELPNALKSVDSPSGDGLNTYVVSKVTRQSGIKVALSGVGGDELFAGYHYFRKWLDLKRGVLPRIPSGGRRLAATALAATGRPKLQRMADILAADEINIASVYPSTRQVMSTTSAMTYSLNGFSLDPVQQMLVDRQDRLSDFPLLSQFTIAELLGYTQNVLLKDIDQFSMASALEVREPFFDHQLIEYMLRVPDDRKLSDRPKNLLVDAMGSSLPTEIVDRKKMGFVLPFEKWMRNELREFCTSRIRNLAQRGVLSADTIIKKWSQFERGTGGVKWSELWHLVVLTEWLENNKF
jgi:asparagine synthase (glutamine-hydrolysing)